MLVRITFGAMAVEMIEADRVEPVCSNGDVKVAVHYRKFVNAQLPYAPQKDLFDPRLCTIEVFHGNELMAIYDQNRLSGVA